MFQKLVFMMIITKQQARQFILLKQGLIGNWRFNGKDGAYDYIRQAGCIQYDPVDVCGKNAEITLQSRVKGFRKTILALWDFKYSWEIYTPAVKRKYGYYTLPILFGDRFVGRIEAIPDRKEGTLFVKGLWWEPDVRVTKKLTNVLDRTLKRFAVFNDCQRIEMN